MSATVPAGAINGLRANPNVRSVDLDGVVYADTALPDAELNNTWGVLRIGAGNVHANGNTGAGVKVGVIDSGIDYMHPDLDGNYVGGYDYVNGDNDPKDDYGHGTHVSGTVAGEDNGFGVIGAAPDASLYAIKVLGASGSGSFGNVIAALQWCVDNGIQVTNNSYGSSLNPGGVVQASFDNAAAAGIVHAAAAGNSGNPGGKRNNVEWPGRYDSVIAVAATDTNDKRASFSSTGPTVEISGPGVGVNSTVMGGGYGTANGTSMATPHVAGTAALVIAGGITGADQVRQALQSTAEDLGKPGRDSQYGFGLVNADGAVPLGPPPPPNDEPVVTINSPGDGATYASGALIAFGGTAMDTEDLDITGSLMWTSDIDGEIGTGGSFSASLSNGSHTITASATDSGSATGTSTVNITDGSPPPGPATASIVDPLVYTTSGGRNGDKHLSVTLTVVDDLGSPVSGASVSISLSSTGGGPWPGTGTTSGAGTVTFTLNNAPTGTYTTTIDSVTGLPPGLVWDEVQPSDNQFTK